MRRWRLGAILAAGLALAGCAPQSATPLPNPAQIAAHEWDHGPPWGPEEIPWVAPPQVLAYGYGPGYWGPGYYWPGYWGVGLGVAAVGYSAPYYPYYGYYGGYYGYPAYPAPATGYVVSQPQPGDQTVRSGQPVPSAPAPDPIFYPRNGQSQAQTEVDRQACNRWATTQAGAMSDAQIFQRATFACMEGRGYTVR